MASVKGQLSKLLLRKTPFLQDFEKLSPSEREQWRDRACIWLLEPRREKFFFGFSPIEQDDMLQLLAASFWAGAEEYDSPE